MSDARFGWHDKGPLLQWSGVGGEKDYHRMPHAPASPRYDGLRRCHYFDEGMRMSRSPVSLQCSLAARYLFAMSAVVWMALFASSALAQTAYPNRAIKVVVPFAAGGPSDVMARTLAQRLNVAFGQPVVVENRTGAAGAIGAEYAAKSAPDGYTLLLAQVGDTISMGLFPNLPYNFQKDFAPISLIGQTAFILVTHPSVPANSLRELIALAKARPGALTFGSSGAGAASHLAGELLKGMAGVDILHVPYKGQAPATTDLLSGQISLMFNNPITSLAHVKAGRLRALAVTTAKRSSSLPEVPTIAESGLPGFDALWRPPVRRGLSSTDSMRKW
jgi:tripartite-type tricarboxylate transporter receptor subunit TctC